MWRVIVVALLAACSASSSSPRASEPPAPPPRAVVPTGAPAPAALPFTSTCVAAADPSLADLRQRAGAATKIGFEEALARNHLRVLVLAVHADEIGEGLQEMAAHAPEGTAVKRTLDGAKGMFVAAETTWSGDPGSPAAWEFVQSDRGDMYRLIRKPIAGVTRVLLCGCREHRCGPPGSGCPACGSTAQTMYGPLPAGTHYKGELELAYTANIVSTEYEQTQGCPPPPDCPKPP
ncbi:MAG TPA: hypothetical protein VFV99_07750 [Kofleriaceae bacterium]|nr:hypothetical protein [Kofleriaceae bacterium]